MLVNLWQAYVLSNILDNDVTNHKHARIYMATSKAVKKRPVGCCERGHFLRWIKISGTSTGTQVLFLHWSSKTSTSQHGLVQQLNMVQ